MSSSRGWELRVVIGDETLLSERCDRPGEAFVIAEGWKQRMLDQGWRQVIPRAGARGPVNARSNL
jgi:hypothetical protein